jgi:hypothetical protein
MRSFSVRNLAIGAVVVVALAGVLPMSVTASTGVARPAILAKTPYGVNLVVDPGFERAHGGDGYAVKALPGWSKQDPAFTATLYGSSGFPRASESKRIGGGKNFAACGDGVNSNNISQPIKLRGLAGAIDSHKVRATLTFSLATYSNLGDMGRGYLGFDTAGNPAVLLDGIDTGELTATDGKFVHLGTSGTLPTGTRQLFVELIGTRTDGDYCDAYFDNVSVVLSEIK